MGTFLDFMGVARRAVRHHGGVTKVIRRAWQVMAFEGLLGLKRKITRLQDNRKTFLSTQDSDEITPHNISLWE